MSAKNLKVLMVAEQCNPDWVSVPLVGYNFYHEISQLAEVTLVTHARNREGFEKYGLHQNITYLEESTIARLYHRVIWNLIAKGRANWPLYNALSFPIYAEFDRQVYQRFGRAVKRGEYDVVHVITPMMPRYPTSLIKACRQTPLLLGPVNGGVPFPKGFEETAKKEKASWNFLKHIGRYLVPGYVATYKKAHKILSGSTYTLEMLKDTFKIADERIDLLYENGISKTFLEPVQKNRNPNQVHLLFVGRLVPYKGADMLIDAIAQLPQAIRDRIVLSIVGDGSERELLEQTVKQSGLQNTVRFVGWIKQQETVDYYRRADVFCFPSIREFGGAVVMEAMACGLPCIVANNGGIAEYVDDTTGFKIDLRSRDFVVQELAAKITLLTENDRLREQMSLKCVEKAHEFEWSAKAVRVMEIYTELREQKTIQQPKTSIYPVHI